MKKLTTKIHLILFTALLAGFTSCSDDDDAGMITEESETIADFVASEEDYSSLAEALDRTGLTATLDAEGTYTVFAPNNAAFEAYLGGTAVADVPVEDLTQILLNHVLAVEARASSLTTGYVNNLATYADTDANLSMYINVDSDVVTINGGSELIGGANVTATDFEFSNGIVHTVDAVIALPTVATFAVADPTFTQLETALTADASFSFVNTLTSAGTFTVFAPTNDAFADLLAELEISGFGDLDTSVLAAALSLHVVNGANVRAE
ncbi:MAG: fasciclin domain-containing protein, partial [Bacteroidota bacterium]|nr:fasciclin domain-containing protein [Bacteroidota bacterium]